MVKYIRFGKISLYYACSNRNLANYKIFSWTWADIHKNSKSILLVESCYNEKNGKVKY